MTTRLLRGDPVFWRGTVLTCIEQYGERVELKTPAGIILTAPWQEAWLMFVKPQRDYPCGCVMGVRDFMWPLGEAG